MVKFTETVNWSMNDTYKKDQNWAANLKFAFFKRQWKICLKLTFGQKLFLNFLPFFRNFVWLYGFFKRVCLPSSKSSPISSNSTAHG